MLGNFITHFWGRLPYEKRRMADDVWQKLFRGKSVVNLGYGWDRIENVQWRVLHGELLFRFFSQEPVGDTFHIDSRTEELVIPSSRGDTATGTSFTSMRASTGMAVSTGIMFPGWCSPRLPAIQCRAIRTMWLRASWASWVV